MKAYSNASLMCGGLDRRRRLETEIAALSIAGRLVGGISPPDQEAGLAAKLRISATTRWQIHR